MRSAHEIAKVEFDPAFDNVDNETFGYIDFTLHQTGDDCTISVVKHDPAADGENDPLVVKKVVSGHRTGRDGGECYGIAQEFSQAVLEKCAGRKINGKDYLGRHLKSSGNPYGDDYSDTYRFRFGWA